MNNLEVNAQKAREAAQKHIRELNIDVEDLKFKNIKKIHASYSSVTFITEMGQYVVIEIDENYGNPEFMFSDMDIEDAHQEGILPDRLYQPLKDAEQALRDYRNEEAAKRKLVEVVRELGGVTKVKIMLDEGRGK